MKIKRSKKTIMLTVDKKVLLTAEYIASSPLYAESELSRKSWSAMFEDLLIKKIDQARQQNDHRRSLIK